MVGGFKLSAGSLSLLAAAGVLLVGGTSAQAADLGGDCCADLEERIAELEATTARKGNRKVSLTISGQVAKAVMFWDDGIESNQYVVDNDNTQTRFRMLGKAKIVDGWEAGYLIEIGLDNASSDGVTQWDPNASGLPAPDQYLGGGTGGGSSFMEVRQSKWFIKSKELGQVTVGLGSGAQDDLYKWGNVGKAYSDAELHYNGRMLIRGTDGRTFRVSSSATSAHLNWDGVANNLDLSRTNNVRYDSPEIAGFVASASWGADDIWDMALRYDQKFGNFHFKAGVAYTEDSDTTGADPLSRGNETKDFVASVGLSEKTTGLYVYGAGGSREIDDQPFVNGTQVDDEAYYYYAQVGITRDLISLGSTNFHVDYGYYDGWGNGLRVRNAIDATSTTENFVITDSETQRWGFGVTQNIKAADMDLYALFNYYETDLTTTRAGGVGPDSLKLATEDWFGIVTGARIQF